jgi:hypothetical protein
VLKEDISAEEALSLLQDAMLEPLGLLVYASEPQVFIQALYRAKRTDPSLEPLQIRQTPEGIAICHPPRADLRYPTDVETESESEGSDSRSEDE